MFIVVYEISITDVESTSKNVARFSATKFRYFSTQMKRKLIKTVCLGTTQKEIRGT